MAFFEGRPWASASAAAGAVAVSASAIGLVLFFRAICVGGAGLAAPVLLFRVSALSIMVSVAASIVALVRKEGGRALLGMGLGSFAALIIAAAVLLLLGIFSLFRF